MPILVAYILFSLTSLTSILMRQTESFPATHLKDQVTLPCKAVAKHAHSKSSVTPKRPPNNFITVGM